MNKNIVVNVEEDKKMLEEMGARLESLGDRMDKLSEDTIRLRMECEWLIKQAEHNIERANQVEWDYSIFE